MKNNKLNGVKVCKVKTNSRNIKARAKTTKAMHNKIKVKVRGLAITNHKITRQSKEIVESAKDFQRFKDLF